ncbi:hypothetical protein ACP70R_018553 [Stipagrostis hirtigluma subsp. patula]
MSGRQGEAMEAPTLPRSQAPPPVPHPPAAPAYSSGHNKFPRPQLKKPYQYGPVAAIHFAKPVVRSSATTIERICARLPSGPFHNLNISTPTAVAIGPYHHGSSHLLGMEAGKRAAVVEFCRAVGLKREEVRQKILPLASSTRSCYDLCDEKLVSIDDGELAEMLLLDGCFLVQFMVSMCREDSPPPGPEDPLMSRAEVHTHIDAIARDILLLENQIPWAVLKALIDLRPGVPVTRFLHRMASAFDVGGSASAKPPSSSSSALDEPADPHHLLGLFHRHQVGKARTQSLRIDILPSPGSTAVELAEMGVKLTATKTRKFGDMKMKQRRWPLGLFGELSLAPVVLNDLTACWLLNMAAYEACLGATQADNFAVSSYVSLVALLVNRGEDVQELRARGIINSAMSDDDTLGFFKWAAPSLRVGERYFHISENLQEYKEKRWIWIATHRFIYQNIKTIVTVLTVVGALSRDSSK